MALTNNGAGGGSGGGPGSGRNSQTIDGAYSVSANQVVLLTRPPLPPSEQGPSVITLLSTGMGTDGLVNVRGSQGVRITAGPPPPIVGPPTESDSTNGVEIVVGPQQNVTIQRGLAFPDFDPLCNQKIEMTPLGITIDAGMTELIIQTLATITLSAGEGMSTITLGPQGITLSAAGGLSTITLGPTGVAITGLPIKLN